MISLKKCRECQKPTHFFVCRNCRLEIRRVYKARVRRESKPVGLPIWGWWEYAVARYKYHNDTERHRKQTLKKLKKYSKHIWDTLGITEGDN